MVIAMPVSLVAVSVEITDVAIAVEISGVAVAVPNTDVSISVSVSATRAGGDYDPGSREHRDEAINRAGPTHEPSGSCCR